jgi:uncharacterized Zn-finger protein
MENHSTVPEADEVTCDYCGRTFTLAGHSPIL